MMDWNDYIENEGEITTLPEGDYEFTVTNFEKGQHAGSAKIPPCNKAILDLTFKAPDGSRGKCKDFLLLHESAKGRAHVIINDDGYNRVDKYLDPEEDEGALPWGN